MRLNQVLKRLARLDVLSTLRKLTAREGLERRKLSSENPFLRGKTTLQDDPSASLFFPKGKEEVSQGRLIKDVEDSAPTTWYEFAE